MALTKERELFLKALTEIRTYGPDDKDMGICWNGSLIVDSLLDYRSDHSDFYNFICVESKDWPKYSGNENYPVPVVTEKYCGKWSGEQGILRIELIDFLIAKLLEEEKQS